MMSQRGMEHGRIQVLAAAWHMICRRIECPDQDILYVEMAKLQGLHAALSGGGHRRKPALDIPASSATLGSGVTDRVQ